MSNKKRVAIVGATGYTGQELVRILVGHPSITIVALTSRQHEGIKYHDLFPHLKGYKLPALSKYHPKKLSRLSDLVFFCLPHAQSQTAVGKAVDLGVAAIDLSADFRLSRHALYRRWYGEHKRPELLKKAVYGLPELYAERISRAGLVANPGCYPVGVILGVSPLLAAGVAEPGPIIADMKSGASGAGHKASLELSFCEVNESLRPYNLYAHRHTPEMEQELSKAAGRAVNLTFSPHLAPINRGILGTIYLSLKKRCQTRNLRQLLAEAYAKSPFVRISSAGELPDLSRVRGTNFVDISVTASPSGRQAIVCTALDNLVKGASGNAVQNMNLMLGLPETAGLLQAPTRP